MIEEKPMKKSLFEKCEEIIFKKMTPARRLFIVILSCVILLCVWTGVKVIFNVVADLW